MAQQHIWRSPDTIPRDGSPILLLMDTFDVYACRLGVEALAPYDASPDTWYGICWDDAMVDDEPETRKRFIGWLPFPLIADPRPHYIPEK